MSLLTSTNPGKDYEVVGTIEISSSEEVKAAVAKAKRAQVAWAQLSLEDRVGFYQRLLQIYEKKAEAIAMMQTREMGKPITESRADVADDQARIKRALEQAKIYLQPEVVDASATQTNTIFFEPYGVVAAITPWNYPSSNFFIATTQALLAGNTVVFKHSEECPLTSQLLAELFVEAGFPEGVFTMLYGDGKVGQLLMEQFIDFIHFTGSSKVGEQLYKFAGEKFIPAVLEMGGSSPGVVFADANLDLVAQSACAERFSNCGQICCALKRLIVHRDVYDEVVKRVVAQVGAMRVGDPLEEATTMGPLVAARQLTLLEEQMADAKEKGVKVEIGGGRPEGLKGAYYMPTVLTHVTKEMRVYREEVFGPVLPIVSFVTDEEAVALANDTIYGLSAFVYSRDLKRADRVASQIQAGNISINAASYFSDNAPFGGYKHSGMGSNDGKYGFKQVTRMKNVGRPK